MGLGMDLMGVDMVGGMDPGMGWGGMGHLMG